MSYPLSIGILASSGGGPASWITKISLGATSLAGNNNYYGDQIAFDSSTNRLYVTYLEGYTNVRYLTLAEIDVATGAVIDETRVYRTASTSYVSRPQLHARDGYVYLGFFETYSSGPAYDQHILKFSSSLSLQWSKSLDYSSQYTKIYVYDFVVDSSGYIHLNYSNSTSCFIVVLDPSGDIYGDEKTIWTSNVYNHKIIDVGTNNLILASGSSSYKQQYIYTQSKITHNTLRSWSLSSSTRNSLVGPVISDGTYIYWAVSTGTGTAPSNRSIHMQKVAADLTGSVIWQQKLEIDTDTNMRSTSTYMGHDVNTFDSNGNPYLSFTNTETGYLYLVKFDKTDGSVLGAMKIGFTTGNIWSYHMSIYTDDTGEGFYLSFQHSVSPYPIFLTHINWMDEINTTVDSKTFIATDATSLIDISTNDYWTTNANAAFAYGTTNTYWTSSTSTNEYGTTGFTFTEQAL